MSKPSHTTTPALCKRAALTALALCVAQAAAADMAADAAGSPAPTASSAAVAAPAAAPAMPTAAMPAAATTPAGTAAAPAAATTAPAAAPAPEPAGRVRVTHLNDSERAAIIKELREDVIKTAKDENWAVPNTFPDWVSRIRFSGDIMFRGESDLYDKGNSNQILNFQAMNSKGPTNIATPAAGQPLTIPFLDTTEDRFVPRIRVHIGMFAQVADNMETIVRLATGNTTNPGTSTVTVGDDFAKQNILLDRAYMNYRPADPVAVALGRMGSPWSTPTDMIWSKELAFDGLALQAHPSITNNTSLLATAGAFSVLSTDPNFPGNSIEKSGNHGDWLYGLQFGIDSQGNDGSSWRGTVAYYDFANIQSELSTPCYAPTTAVSCSTDNSVPMFMQKGNTLFAIRNLQLVNSTDPQYQYFGLASAFRLLDLNATYDMVWQGPVHVAFDADYVKNLAFNRGDIIADQPVNNLGSCANSNCTAPFVGGNTGKQIQTRIGYPKVSERGQWSVLLGYRDVESDAVVDAFNDQDFHLGGTNAKGYFVGGSLGFTHNAWLTARWLSATEVSGPPLTIDVFQLDVNARF